MKPIRLSTYNVRYFGHETRGLASQDRTLNKVVKALVGLRGGTPDVLCFQEIDTLSLRADLGRSRRPTNGEAKKPQFQRFVEAFHAELQNIGADITYQAFYFPAHQYKLSRTRNFYTTGLAVLVHPSLEVLKTDYEQPHDITCRRLERFARWKQTRICAHVRLKQSTGGVIDLFNTHLSMPSFWTKDIWNYTHRLGYGKNQLEEAKNLVARINAVRHPDSHVVLVGDFNSYPGSPVYEFLNSQPLLTDAFRLFHDYDPPRTRDFPTAGFAGLQLPIDYVFSSPNVEWVDFDGTHAYGLNGGSFHGLSDHVPLIGRGRFL